MSYEYLKSIISAFSCDQSSKDQLNALVDKVNKQCSAKKKLEAEIMILRCKNVHLEMEMLTLNTVEKTIKATEKACMMANELLGEATDECYGLGHDIAGIDTNKMKDYNEQVYNAKVEEMQPEMQKYYEERKIYYETLESQQSLKELRQAMSKNSEISEELESKTAVFADELEKSKQWHEETEMIYKIAKFDLAHEEKQLADARFEADKMDAMRRTYNTYKDILNRFN